MSVNMSKIPEWKAKRKKALIAICTLGLSEVPWKEHFVDSSKADNGMSFEKSVVGFMFKIIWFIFWGVILAVIFWVVNIFKFINYSLSISMNKNK